MNTETQKQLRAIDRSCRKEIDPSILADLFLIAEDIPMSREDLIAEVLALASEYPTLADRLVCMQQANWPLYIGRVQRSQICDLDHECFIFRYGRGDK